MKQLGVIHYQENLNNNMLAKQIEKNIEEFIEKGADLEHTRWSKWQEYMHGFCIEKTITPPETANISYQAMTFPKKLFDRWQKQINTQYKNLTEREKESDRKEVEVYMPLLIQAQLSMIDTMIKCQKQEEQRLQMIKLKSYLGLSDKDIGIKMGELRQCRRTLDYLKTERSKIK